jgi:hypothetical protein
MWFLVDLGEVDLGEVGRETRGRRRDRYSLEVEAGGQNPQQLSTRRCKS